MACALAGLALALLVAAATALIRRSRRRAAAFEAALLATVRARAEQAAPGLDIAIDPEAVTLRGASPRRALPLGRLLQAARAGHGAEAVAAAALDLLTDPPRPHDGPFSLKVHGPRVRAHLRTPATMALRPREPRPAQRRIEDLNLVVTYSVDGRFVTEDQLHEQGIDGRDLHGIALAVQRQLFDEELPRRALEAGQEVLHSTDGSAGAALLTLHDALEPGEELAARLEGPDWLGLAPPGHTWEGSGADVAHPAADLAIRPDGYRIL